MSDVVGDPDCWFSHAAAHIICFSAWGRLILYVFQHGDNLLFGAMSVQQTTRAITVVIPSTPPTRMHIQSYAKNTVLSGPEQPSVVKGLFEFIYYYMYYFNRVQC